MLIWRYIAAAYESGIQDMQHGSLESEYGRRHDPWPGGLIHGHVEMSLCGRC